MNNLERLELLEKRRTLPDDEFKVLLDTFTEEDLQFAMKRAKEIRESIFGNEVFIRGLIELTSYCVCDCLYCGIRRGNRTAERYRLSKEEVLSCCKTGYELGFRTFVIQGGEDPYYTDKVMTDIVSSIRKEYEDCAITLSLGERTKESYKRLYEAGADRYLLRHETADEEHYGKLHPKGEQLQIRMKHLWDLKEIGYQVGTGFMVGSPFQNSSTLVKDLRFLRELNPEMVGIGPFVPHHESVFRDYDHGSLELTLMLLSIIRLMMPDALIPSTTSLGTIHPKGRDLGMQAGANVVMPNLSPTQVRKKYLLYDNKAFTGCEAAESLGLLEKSMESIGYQVVVHRGDSRRAKERIK
jgi:biotin synthase